MNENIFVILNIMKNITKIILIVIIVVIVIVAHTQHKEQSPETNTQERTISTSLDWDAFQARTQDSNTVVIDIRTPEETAEGKLFPDAPELDFYEADYEEQIANLDPNKEYLIYCRSGNRSGKSIPIFEKYGLSVQHLEGGHKATPEGSLK